MAPGRDLGGFVERVGADPSASSLHELEYRDAKRHLAEHGRAEGPPGHLYTRSEFLRRALPAEAIATLVEHLGRAPAHAVLDLTP